MSARWSIGTSFAGGGSVRIPRSRFVVEARVSDATEIISRGPLDVVVVDDQPDGADALADLLAEYGCAVRVANLGLDALSLLEERRPDLLFLDLGLPELDGYEVARAVRHRFGDAIRVVAVTGFNTPEARQLAEWAGFDGFISKPFKAQDIKASLLRPMNA